MTVDVDLPRKLTRKWVLRVVANEIKAEVADDGEAVGVEGVVDGLGQRGGVDRVVTIPVQVAASGDA